MIPFAAVAAEPIEPFEIHQLAEDRGISLADAEQRLSWQRELPALSASAKSALDRRFGGIWVDNQDGDRIKLGIVRPDSQATAAAQSAVRSVGLDGAVDLISVARSDSTLQTLYERASQRVRDVNSRAVAALGVGIRTDLNALQFSVPQDARLTSEQQALVDTRLTLGATTKLDFITGRFQDQTCIYPEVAQCDVPLRGGIFIGIRTPPNGFSCTGGFVSRSRSDAKLYFLTAGHCRTFDNTNQWFTFLATGNEKVLGPFHNHYDSGFGDAGIIRVLDETGWVPRSWVFVTGGSETNSNHQYRIRSDADPTQGQRICITGAFFGRSDCGVVTNPDYCCTPGGGRLRASYCSVDGDSGGPVYATNTAFGVHEGRLSIGLCDAVATRARVAEDLMNVNITHASD